MQGHKPIVEWRGACRRIWANYGVNIRNTPRRLRDLPARRRAAANANTVLRSQTVASTSQSSPQSTHCPVCLIVCLMASVTLPSFHLDTVCVAPVFRTSLQPLQYVHGVLYAELIFPTPYVSISRRNTNDACSRFYRTMHFSAKRGIAIACRLSVCLSVCLSVTLVNCDHIG